MSDNNPAAHLTENPLEKAVLDPTGIDKLTAAGLLSSKENLALRQACRDAPVWHRWAGNALLMVAIGHGLAAIVFFFAYNWAGMTGNLKLAIIGTGLGLSGIGFALLPREHVAGQAFGIATTMLIGVLFAVIGQIYQTGADAWQLFALWAGLSLPLAITARFAVHALVWLVIANIAWITFGVQYAEPLNWFNSDAILVFAGFAMLACLVARNLLVGQFRQSWLDYGWTLVLPGLMGLIYLAINAFRANADVTATDIWQYVGTIGFYIVSVTITVYYGFKREGFALACLAAAGLAIVIGHFLAMQILGLPVRPQDQIEQLAVMTLIGLGLVAAYALWLRQSWQRIAAKGRQP